VRCLPLPCPHLSGAGGHKPRFFAIAHTAINRRRIYLSHFTLTVSRQTGHVAHRVQIPPHQRSGPRTRPRDKRTASGICRRAILNTATQQEGPIRRRVAVSFGAQSCLVRNRTQNLNHLHQVPKLQTSRQMRRSHPRNGFGGLQEGRLGKCHRRRKA
jgi:hypothetical protein